jgi:ankyrin repeat protein
MPAIEYLVEHKADVNSKNNEGVTPLHLASATSCEICKYLIDHGADPNQRDNKKETPLHWAARSRKYENMCQCLIEHTSSVEINPTNIHGEIPLHQTLDAYYGELTFLIKQGAEVNHKNNRGESPLHYALRRRCYKIMYYLLEGGADVNLADDNGATSAET